MTVRTESGSSELHKMIPSANCFRFQNWIARICSEKCDYLAFLKTEKQLFFSQASDSLTPQTFHQDRLSAGAEPLPWSRNPASGFGFLPTVRTESGSSEFHKMIPSANCFRFQNWIARICSEKRDYLAFLKTKSSFSSARHPIRSGRNFLPEPVVRRSGTSSMVPESGVRIWLSAFSGTSGTRRAQRPGLRCTG